MRGISVETKKDEVTGEFVVTARMSMELIQAGTVDRIFEDVEKEIVKRIATKAVEEMTPAVMEKLNVMAISNAVSIRIMPELVKRTIER